MMESKCKYTVTLRTGLSPDSKVLKVLKERIESLASAEDFALKYAADEANEKELGCKSYYCRVLHFEEEGAAAVDYGSHSKFILVTPSEEEEQA